MFSAFLWHLGRENASSAPKRVDGVRLGLFVRFAKSNHFGLCLFYSSEQRKKTLKTPITEIYSNSEKTRAWKRQGSVKGRREKRKQIVGILLSQLLSRSIADTNPLQTSFVDELHYGEFRTSKLNGLGWKAKKNMLVSKFCRCTHAKSIASIDEASFLSRRTRSYTKTIHLTTEGSAGARDDGI